MHEKCGHLTQENLPVKAIRPFLGKIRLDSIGCADFPVQDPKRHPGFLYFQFCIVMTIDFG